MTYEVLNGIGNVVAAFEIKSMADEYAETYPNAKKNIKDREKKSSGKD